MAQHRARPTRARRRWLPVLGAGALLGALALVLVTSLGSGAAPLTRDEDCATLRVVTAGSFAPVLDGVAPAVASGPGCARLDLTVADGREAVERAHGADLWI